MATRPSRLAVQKTGRVTVAVDADIDAVWDVVRDVRGGRGGVGGCFGNIAIEPPRSPPICAVSALSRRRAARSDDGLSSALPPSTEPSAS